MLERGRGSRTQVGFLHGAVMQVSLSYSPQVFFFSTFLLNQGQKKRKAVKNMRSKILESPVREGRVHSAQFSVRRADVLELCSSAS